MLSVALADPAWTAARMAASVGSEGTSAAAAGAGAACECLASVGAWRRGLVERRSVGDDAPSRCGIASLDDDAEMSRLSKVNEVGNEGVAR